MTKVSPLTSTIRDPIRMTLVEIQKARKANLSFMEIGLVRVNGSLRPWGTLWRANIGKSQATP